MENEKALNEKALIAVERLNPVEIFQNGGMKPILQEIEKKATSIVADVETDEGRKDIASIAYRVARSKTLIDDMGKSLVSDWKKKAKVVDAVRKKARDFLDELKDRVRTPLTEWEAVEARKKEEEDRNERAKVQARIEELQKYGVILPFVEVATFNEAEYDAMLDRAIDEYAAEQERIEVARLDRVEEAKRLADERAELDRLRKEQEARDRVEREKREAEERKLAEERAAIEAEKKALEAAKKAEQDRKDREAFEAQAKENARIKAEKDAKEKAEREEQGRIEKEAAAARALKLRPDREKLTAYFDSILSVPEPKELGREAKHVLDWLVKELMKLDDRLSEHLSEL